MLSTSFNNTKATHVQSSFTKDSDSKPSSDYSPVYAQEVIEHGILKNGNNGTVPSTKQNTLSRDAYEKALISGNEGAKGASNSRKVLEYYHSIQKLNRFKEVLVNEATAKDVSFITGTDNGCLLLDNSQCLGETTLVEGKRNELHEAVNPEGDSLSNELLEKQYREMNVMNQYGNFFNKIKERDFVAKQRKQVKSHSPSKYSTIKGHLYKYTSMKKYGNNLVNYGKNKSFVEDLPHIHESSSVSPNKMLASIGGDRLYIDSLMTKHPRILNVPMKNEQNISSPKIVDISPKAARFFPHKVAYRDMGPQLDSSNIQSNDKKFDRRYKNNDADIVKMFLQYKEQMNNDKARQAKEHVKISVSSIGHISHMLSNSDQKNSFQVVVTREKDAIKSFNPLEFGPRKRQSNDDVHSRVLAPLSYRKSDSPISFAGKGITYYNNKSYTEDADPLMLHGNKLNAQATNKREYPASPYPAVENEKKGKSILLKRVSMREEGKDNIPSLLQKSPARKSEELLLLDKIALNEKNRKKVITDDSYIGQDTFIHRDSSSQEPSPRDEIPRSSTSLRQSASESSGKLRNAATLDANGSNENRIDGEGNINPNDSHINDRSYYQKGGSAHVNIMSKVRSGVHSGARSSDSKERASNQEKKDGASTDNEKRPRADSTTRKESSDLSSQKKPLSAHGVNRNSLDMKKVCNKNTPLAKIKENMQERSLERQRNAKQVLNSSNVSKTSSGVPNKGNTRAGETSLRGGSNKTPETETQRPVKVYTYNNNNNTSYTKTYKEPQPEPEQKPARTKFPMFFVPRDHYSFVIMPGNNSRLVRMCLEKRADWKETPDINTLFNFKWQPFSKGLKFERLTTSFGLKQMLNHLEYHHELTSKDGLFKNLYSFCELNKINVFDYVPITFLVEVESQDYAPNLEKFIMYFNMVQNVIEKDKLDKLKLAEVAQQEETPESPETEKKLKVPLTLLQKVNNKLQSYAFSNERRAVFHTQTKLSSTSFDGYNLWIFKPTGLNRGRGVHVFQTLAELKKLIKEYSEGMPISSFSPPQPVPQAALQNSSAVAPNQPLTEEPTPTVSAPLPTIKIHSFVIQKYIEKPLLIHGRKFDIRVWVLVDQDLKCYFFKEGYIRTSSEEYTMDADSIDKRYIHLTNNAVQKYSENYGQFEDGNQMSFESFGNYINENYPGRNYNIRTDLIGKMHEYVTLSMQSVRKKLNLEDRKFCFELFGYDFIIDEEFKLWMIEVNTNPCIEESSNLLKMLLPRMIDDALKITVDVIFPNKKKKAQQEEDSKLEVIKEIENSPFPVTGYADDESMWEFLCQIGINRNAAHIPYSNKYGVKGLRSVAAKQKTTAEKKEEEKTQNESMIGTSDVGKPEEEKTNQL